VRLRSVHQRSGELTKYLTFSLDNLVVGAVLPRLIVHIFQGLSTQASGKWPEYSGAVQVSELQTSVSDAEESTVDKTSTS